jgi:hypothetical protein
MIKIQIEERRGVNKRKREVQKRHMVSRRNKNDCKKVVIEEVNTE